MKSTFILLMLLAYNVAWGQVLENDLMKEKRNIEERIAQLFVSTDKHEWTALKEIFNEQVGLDYSSFTGKPGGILSSSEIIKQWSAFLPGFEYTHHQIGNYLIDVEGESAQVFCYGTATHYLEHPNGNVWTVVGSYDFNLIRKEGLWLVSSMRFNYKYQTGNEELVQHAINQLNK